MPGGAKRPEGVVFGEGSPFLYDDAIMQNRHNLIAIGIALIAAIAIAAYVLINRVDVFPGTPTSTSTSTQNVDGLIVEGEGAIVTEGPPQLAAPSYERPLTFGDDLSAEVQAALTNQYERTVAILRENPQSFEAWNNLAILRKMTRDYEGAEIVWQYLARLYTESTIPFTNLGVLYMDFLTDYAKAEASFRQSIRNDTHDINAYRQLVSLYTTYGYKSTSTALILIEEGLDENPGNETLLSLRTELQASL